MNRSHLRLVAAPAALLLAAGCAGEATTGPQSSGMPPAAPSVGLEVANPSVYAQGVRWVTPLRASVSTSMQIGPKGGTIELKQTGLKIIVPKGAVLLNTTIRVTALAGSAVAYDFQPHGSRFLQPLRLEQELKPIAWQKVDPRTLEVGYFASPSLLAPLDGVALVSEFLPLDLDITGSKAKFNVCHFSGYMVASGRKR